MSDPIRRRPLSSALLTYSRLPTSSTTDIADDSFAHFLRCALSPPTPGPGRKLIISFVVSAASEDRNRVCRTGKEDHEMDLKAVVAEV